MKINLPWKARLTLYITTVVGTPVVTYLLAKGIIGTIEVNLWLGEVAVASAIAAFNTSPTAEEELAIDQEQEEHPLED